MKRLIEIDDDKICKTVLGLQEQEDYEGELYTVELLTINKYVYQDIPGKSPKDALRNLKRYLDVSPTHIDDCALETQNYKLMSIEKQDEGFIGGMLD